MAGSLRTVTLYGAHGQVRTLVCAANSPIDLTTDSGLWGIAPVEFATRRVIGAPGEKIESQRRSPRTFAVPVLLSGKTELEIDQLLGELESLLDPERDVRIVFKRPDGTQREITARYLEGAENITVKHAKHIEVKVPLVFRAFYPFWRSGEGLRGLGQTFADGGFANINPLYLINEGDVRAWPEITITGNAQNIECANLTTGQVFRIVRILPANETVRIDTDPQTFGVYLNNWQGFPTVMDPYSEFWPLEPGVNILLFRAVTLGVEPLGTFNITWREEFGSA